MLENLKHYKIKLASNSPRRRELLSGLGIDYEVKLLPGIDESYPDTLKGEDIPMYIAREKADAYRPLMQADELIITADTIVCIDGEVLGKPSDGAEAAAMLRKLSGRTHEVITGVCLTTTRLQRTFAAVTEVTFDTLTDEEIAYYVERYRPLDKAGAYAIQGLFGKHIQKINGDYTNVVGLPVGRVYRELRKNGWIAEWRSD